jgi:hypothetical protein
MKNIFKEKAKSAKNKLSRSYNQKLLVCGALVFVVVFGILSGITT